MVRGSVDRVTVDEVHGWAYGAERRKPVMVQAVLNGEVLGEAVAHNYREDLAAAGLGDGRSGFVISLSRAVDPLYLPFLVVKLNSGDAELPRAAMLGTGEYLYALHRTHPAAGRHRSLLGGLWTDRTDADDLLRSKAETGAVSSAALPALETLVGQGYAVLAAGADDLAWRTSPSGAARKLTDDPGVLAVLHAVLEDQPLTVKVELVTRSAGFSQASARNAAPSPAECVELVAPARGEAVLEIVRGSHAMPEYAPHGASRWTAADIVGVQAAEAMGLVERVALQRGEVCLMGPGTIYRVADQGEVARVLCLPLRARPLAFSGIADAAREAPALAAATAD